MWLSDKIDQSFFRYIVRFIYPQYKRPVRGYLKHYQVLSRYFFMQKIVGINRKVPWPVDFRSKILGWEHIKKGIICDPGDNPGIYINAYGGLTLGDNVEIAANTVIVTTNHNKYDQRKTWGPVGVSIGSNVWIGANCVILPGAVIGNEVTIGAGCIIRGEIPSGSTVKQTEQSLVITPKSRPYEWDIYSEELT